MSMILWMHVNAGNMCKPKREIHFWADLGRLPRKLGTAWIAWPSHKCLPISWAPPKLPRPFACAPSRPDDDAILCNSHPFLIALMYHAESCSFVQRHAVQMFGILIYIYNTPQHATALRKAAATSPLLSLLGLYRNDLWMYELSWTFYSSMMLNASNT